MKSFVLFALLAVVPACLGAATLQYNGPITVGVPQEGDRISWRMVLRVNPIPGAVSTATVTPKLSIGERINAITFTEQGPPQGGYVSSVRGLGTGLVTFTITSQRGGGFHFIAEMWGHFVPTNRSVVSSGLEGRANCMLTVSDGEMTEASDCNVIVG
uniref:Reelin domain-containing protein n=1 Tax=Heliothis virescens TaxID=7102 RepID=A0A2A4IXW9_HELVI